MGQGSDPFSIEVNSLITKTSFHLTFGKTMCIIHNNSAPATYCGSVLLGSYLLCRSIDLRLGINWKFLKRGLVFWQKEQ